MANTLIGTKSQPEELFVVYMPDGRIWGVRWSESQALECTKQDGWEYKHYVPSKAGAGFDAR